MAVPQVDLKAQFAGIREEVMAAVAEVFESQRFIMGPAVTGLETEVAAYSQCAHGVGVSSGTDALLVALMAEGIGPGDEVITTPYTFFATAGCVARVGATPVFVDVRDDTLNIDTTLIEAAITKNTRAIVPVHLFGQMCDMDAVMDIANRHNLVVIEDAAQAIGAERDGKRAGSMGHYGCFSFFPAKNLGAAGDGGMVVTNDDERADKIRLLRTHGSRNKYMHDVIGGNFRLDALQAAIVSVKLNHLDAWTEARGSNAKRYDRLFTESGLVEHGNVTLPTVASNRPVWNQYVLRAKRRDELVEHLRAQSIGCAVYYRRPLHQQKCFADLPQVMLPVAEAASLDCIAIPMFPELSEDQATEVVGAIAAFHSS